jgi:methionyl-tRNA synthetase
MEIVRAHGPDAFRYYFMKECPFGGDGNYSKKRFAEVYNADLANTLGNLYSRTLSMCVKYFDGRLPRAGSVEPTAWLGGLALAPLVEELRQLIASFEYNVALQRIWLELLPAANRYIDVTAPFKLARTDLDACQDVLINLAEAIRVVAILVKPFLPATAATFYRAFNYAPVQEWEAVCYGDALRRPPLETLEVTAPLVGGKPTPLFPKIEVEDEPPLA